MLRRALEGLAGVGVGWPAPRRCLWSMRRYARSGRVAPSDRVESSRSDAILPIRWNLPDGRVLSEDLRRESASPMPPPLTVPGTNPQPIRFVQWPGTVVRRRSSRPQWLKLVDPSGKVLTTDAGWSSSVARRAHNPEVAGSNPVPATRKTRYLNEKSLRYRVLFCSDKAESLCYSLPFVRTHSRRGLRVKMCVWLGVSRGLDLAFLNAD